MTTLIPKYDQGSTGAVNRSFDKKLQEYVSTEDFDGADIGAKINQAVASGATAIRVSKVGAISTSPNLPVGTVIDFVPGVYTISTTWSMSHHGVIYNFNGAVFRTSVTGPVFDIGKLSAVTPGTVNTSGTAVTWVSGPKLNDFDIGDNIIINGVVYNIDSINSATSITLANSAGTQTGVAYSGIMNPQNSVNNSSNNTSVMIRDVNISHASGTGVGVRGSFAFNLVLENVNTNLYFDTGIDLLGCIGSQVNVSSQASPITVNSYTAAGYATGSNGSTITASVQGIISGTRALYIGNSGVVNLYDCRLEGNGSTYGLEIDAASRIIVTGSYFENNGNGTANAADIYVHNSSTFIELNSGQITTVGPASNNGGAAILLDATSEMLLMNYYINGNNNSYEYGIKTSSGTAVQQLNNTIIGCTSLFGTVTSPNSGLNADSFVLNSHGEIQARSLYSATKELIYNGNFSQGATAWTLGTGWSIGGGVAIATAVTGNAGLSQSVIGSMVIGSYYRLTFTISGYSAGTLIAYINESLSTYTYGANGTYTAIFQQNSKDNSVALLGSGGLSCNVDNISLVPVPITADEIVNLNNSLKLVPKGPFANNAAAIAGGCVVGELYYVNAATDPQPIYIVH
jgi:hypothetical protein